MENVTERTSNPFDMEPPCAERTPGGHAAVFGYGDANADVHVVGDNPRIHGGGESGVPFTGTPGGDRLRSVLAEVGLIDDDGERPSPVDCFLSYLHSCWPADGTPTDDAYADLEPFFDAELRAIGAHVLVAVGDRPVDHVVRTYTSRADRVGTDASALHAAELHGRGWLVVPVADPADWTDDQRRALVERLDAVLSGDYRQISDLGRFQPHADPYYVR